MSLHASFKKSDNITVVWVLGETQTAAVVHELFELFRLIFAELLDSNFLLLFLNVRVLFGLGSAWKSLPGQRTFQEVEQHVTNRFQVVSSRLLVTNVSVN